MTRSPGKPKEFFSRSEVAELFNVSPNTITRWAEAGKLPYVRTLGGHRRYERGTIVELAQTFIEEAEQQEEERVKTITLTVPRMYGDHHVLAVRNVLAQLSGVTEVWASAAFQQVQVTYDPEDVSVEGIVAELAQAGYATENGHGWRIPFKRRKDPAWDTLGLRMTQTHPADV